MSISTATTEPRTPAESSRSGLGGDGLDPAEIDRIVKIVIQRLKQLEKDGCNASSDAPGAANNSAVGSLEITDRVVTLSGIADRLAGVRKLLVTPDAIVTPLVRDEMKARGICLERSPRASADDSVPGCVTGGSRTRRETFRVLRTSGQFVPTDWLKSLGTPHIISAVDYGQLADHFARCNDLLPGICFAAQPHVAVAMLNRSPGVKAGFARSLQDVAEIISVLGANVLVLDIVQEKAGQRELVSRFLERFKGGRR